MRLKELYRREILPKLKEKFGYRNDLAAPRIIRVVVNVGFGRYFKEKDYIENVKKGLAAITGQKPILTKAKKSISSFKVRQGNIIGAKVSIGGDRMYDFIDKLVRITFPRVRDFRGINEKSVDNSGNLTVGFREHLSFPEIKSDEVDNVFGLEICISTSAKTREEGLELFKLLGFPFKK